MGSWYAAQHVSRVDAVAEKMYLAFLEEDGGSFLARTGNLVRSNTLRTKKTKDAFEILLTAKDEMCNEISEDCRFWSKALVSHALKKTVTKHDVEVPQLPGFSWANWLKKQSTLVHSLCKRATRNRKGGKPMGSCENPDNMPTLDYVPDQDLSVPVVVLMLFRIVCLVEVVVGLLSLFLDSCFLVAVIGDADVIVWTLLLLWLWLWLPILCCFPCHLPSQCRTWIQRLRRPRLQLQKIAHRQWNLG